MSGSLEKLRALSSKLEKKLEEKKRVQTNVPNNVGTSTESVVKTPLEKPIEQVAAVTPVKKPVEKRSTVAKVTHKRKTAKNATSENVRQENIDRVKVLYDKLKIFEKSPDFNMIFMYKAMNLSGIGLKEEDFGQLREGKYIQVIAITYEPDQYGKKRAKNISLGYFGKAETLDSHLKNNIIEFVLRWRYEKAFQNVEHYKELIQKIDTPPNTLF